MKKITILTFTFVVACLSIFASSLEPSITNVRDLTTDQLNEMMERAHPENILEFSAQSTLPISFYLTGNIVNLIEEENKVGILEIKETFYARFGEEGWTFSANLVDWKSFLEFITGTASIEFRVEQGKPFFRLGAEANRRS